MSVTTILDEARKKFEQKYPHHNFKWSYRNNKLLGLCPNHSDKHPSFNIYIYNGKVYYKCFACGFKGIVKGLMIDNFSLESSLTTELIDSSTEIIKAVSEEFNANFEPLLLYEESQYKHTALNFLYSRGITNDDIVEHFIGICGNPESRYFGYIGIPLYNENKEFVFFTARNFLNLGGSSPKYILPSLPKQNNLYLFYRDSSLAVICEGVFDAINVYKAGCSAVCILGKFMNDVQVLKLQNLMFKKIIIGLDNDAIKDAVNLSKTLKAKGMIVDVITPSKPYKDFGEMPVEEIKKVLKTENNIYNKVTMLLNK